MKTPSHSNLIIHSSLALALALVLWTPVQAQIARPVENNAMMTDKTPQAPAAQPPQSVRDKKMTKCQPAMMQRHQAMMADMKAQNAELTAQVAAMNGAPADKKLDLLAAIVTRLVEQRTAMNARMGMMQEEMMKCPMQDMAMEAKAMPEHSMMQGMDEKPKSDTKDQE